MSLVGKITLVAGCVIITLIAVAVSISAIVAPTYACNVAKYDIKGELTTSGIFSSYGDDGVSWLQSYSEDIIAGIELSEEDENIRAVLIEVDSPGGSPVAGEEVANAIMRSSKPTIAVIRSLGASAAYWAVSSSDKIYASANADVGGIGVVVSYVDQVEKNEREGLNYNAVTSGRYKLLGDPNAKLSDEEREILQRDVDAVHHNFVSAVSTNRSLPIEQVEYMADGSTMLGSMALDTGLIDEVGDLYAAKRYIADLIGEEVRLCSDELAW